MTDEYANHSGTLTAPASAAEMIVPHDVNPLAYVTRAFYVGQAGDVTLKLKSGDVVTLRDVQAGVIYPLRVAQVMATGTTAVELVGLR